MAAYSILCDSRLLPADALRVPKASEPPAEETEPAEAELGYGRRAWAALIASSLSVQT